MFGYQTWPSVNSLKWDDDPIIAINAISWTELGSLSGTDEAKPPAMVWGSAIINYPWKRAYTF